MTAVAWHCYGGDVSAQTAVHDKYPDKDAYFTECSGGEWAPDVGRQSEVERLEDGDRQCAWMGERRRTLESRARREAWSASRRLRRLPRRRHDHSATGEITRNPEYYALAHASRFVRPGAVRIESSAPNGFETVAFRNADDRSTALIVLNTKTTPSQLVVRVGQLSFTTSLPGGAVATFTWK